MANSLRTGTRNAVSLPIFLTPAFAESRTITSTISTSRFFSSSSTQRNQKKTSGKNKQRGVSALRSTGPRTQMTLSNHLVLPQPAKNSAARRAEFDEGNSSHGLWRFFNKDKTSMMPPSDEGTHGRAWASRELRKKDYTDLWKLYWVCVREANQIVTRQNERDRVYAGYGATEADMRLKAVKSTQFRIRKVLLDRSDEHAMVKTLLETKRLRELFPNAEDELQLNGPVDQFDQSVVQVNEINETAEPQEQDSSRNSIQSGRMVEGRTTGDQPSTSPKQKLSE